MILIDRFIYTFLDSSRGPSEDGGFILPDTNLNIETVGLR
jgi:hypothetical protein